MKKLLALVLMVAVGVGILVALRHYKPGREGGLSRQDLPGAGALERLSKELGITSDEIGAVMFVCNQTSHGDREAVIRTCPKCEGKNRFFQHPSKPAFYCFDCEEKLPESKIVCDGCGKPPSNPVRLKR
jgi:hypothetical protein